MSEQRTRWTTFKTTSHRASPKVNAEKPFRPRLEQRFLSLGIFCLHVMFIFLSRSSPVVPTGYSTA